MSPSCPISLQRIDSHLVRIIALQVIAIALLLLWSGSLLFAFILLFDFLVRTLELKQLSPFAHIGKFVINHFHIKPQLCDEAPKRFALYLGLAIIGFFTLLFVFGFSKVASILVGILLVCAFLEAAFDYCIGCKIHHYLQLIWVRK